jgi:DNA processing protein
VDTALLALCSLPLLGPMTVRRLLRHFGSAEAVFGADTGELARVPGMGGKRAAGIREFGGFEELERNLALLRREGVRVCLEGEEGYPEGLLALGEDAPLVLYLRGEIVREDQFAVAMVGSRRPTRYGLATAETMAAELAGMGLTVVSGLARGVDAAAHKGALKAGGRTLGVLGSGIDVLYPAENRGLMLRMTETGAVMSEFPPGRPPLQQNFPRRNRLISGLSLGVVVIEAAARSGSLITARHALEQGKEVFAVPGNISSAVSEGTNALIRDGARVALGAQDVIQELAPQLRGYIKSARRGDEVPLSDEEKALCEAMSREPRHIDDISRECGMGVSTALALLLQLELKGVVGQTEGKRFQIL